MFNFDEAVEIALRTWYPVDHEWHSNPHHPLMKLAGEWGELLDDYAKGIYKPDYVFEPIDELGDIWYYLRILCHQRNRYYPTEFYMSTDDIDFLIATAGSHSFQALCSYFRGSTVPIFYLDISYTVICQICEAYNITLDELTAANREKLKPGSKRGDQWMKARKSNDTN